MPCPVSGRALFFLFYDDLEVVFLAAAEDQTVCEVFGGVGGGGVCYFLIAGGDAALLDVAAGRARF